MMKPKEIKSIYLSARIIRCFPQFLHIESVQGKEIAICALLQSDICFLIWDSTLCLQDTPISVTSGISEATTAILFGISPRQVSDFTLRHTEKLSLTEKAKQLNIHVTGSGTVVSQTPMAGTTVEEGTVINVTLQQRITEAH